MENITLPKADAEIPLKETVLIGGVEPLWRERQLPSSFHKGELKRRIKTHRSQGRNLGGMGVRWKGRKGK